MTLTLRLVLMVAALICFVASEMAGYIKSTDPYQHLISTSAGVGDSVWRLDEMSITQMHLYGTGDIVDLSTPIVSSVRHHERFNKPHLIAEWLMKTDFAAVVQVSRDLSVPKVTSPAPSTKGAGTR